MNQLLMHLNNPGMPEVGLSLTGRRPLGTIGHQKLEQTSASCEALSSEDEAEAFLSACPQPLQDIFLCTVTAVCSWCFVRSNDLQWLHDQLEDLWRCQDVPGWVHLSAVASLCHYVGAVGGAQSRCRLCHS